MPPSFRIPRANRGPGRSSLTRTKLLRGKSILPRTWETENERKQLLCNTAHPSLRSRVSRAGAAPAAIPARGPAEPPPLRPDAAPGPRVRPAWGPPPSSPRNTLSEGEREIKIRGGGGGGKGGQSLAEVGDWRARAHTSPAGDIPPLPPPPPHLPGRPSQSAGSGRAGAAPRRGGQGRRQLLPRPAAARRAAPSLRVRRQPPPGAPVGAGGARTWSDMARPRCVRQARLGRCRRSAPFSARSANTGRGAGGISCAPELTSRPARRGAARPARRLLPGRTGSPREAPPAAPPPSPANPEAPLPRAGPHRPGPRRRRGKAAGPRRGPPAALPGPRGQARPLRAQAAPAGPAAEGHLMACPGERKWVFL